MKRAITWSYDGLYYLTVSLLFLAVVLRSLLIYSPIPGVLSRVLALLTAWLILVGTQPSLTRRWPGYFSVYLALQSALIVGLMLSPGASDYFAILFAVLGMQAMQLLPLRAGVACIAIFTPLTALTLAPSAGLLSGIAFALMYAAANIFVGFFSLAARRAGEAHCRNQSTLQELQAANAQLQAYAQQIEQMTATRERHRLARELHDSVTQTVFSMTLTTQSALLLLDRDPGRVRSQLDHLSDLARSALSETQTLISELRPETPALAGLPPALRQHLAQREFPAGLSASLEVDGDRPLTPTEEQALLRIVQEALNNVVKHARASRACVHLHLVEAPWIEIEDNGLGFDMAQVGHGRGIGLSSMRERAAEIGWDLRAVSSPGAGTHVRVAKEGAKHANGREDQGPDRG